MSMMGAGVTRSILIVVVLLATPDAFAARVTIAPLAGRAAQPCTAALTEIAREEVELLPWRSPFRRPPPGTWARLSRWLLANGVEIGAEVVVLGFLSGQRIVLEAYDRHQLKLVGLKHMTMGKRCRFSSSERALLAEWMRSITKGRSRLDEETGVAASSTTAPSGDDPHARPLMDIDVSGGEEPRVEEPQRARSESARGDAGRGLRSGRSGDQTEPALAEGPTIIAEIELAIIGRNFGYSRVGSAGLRGFDIAPMAVPGIALEAYPFAGEAATGLGDLSAGVRLRQGIAARGSPGGGTAEHDARYAELEASLGYRLETDLGLVLHPRLGYQRTTVSLVPASDGARSDLPGVRYGSVELGIDALLTVGGSVAIVGALSYLVVLSGGEVFSAAFFPNGTALGLTAEGGVRLSITPSLSLGLLGAFESYHLSLAAGPTDRLVAASARDSLMAARTTLRFEL